MSTPTTRQPGDPDRDAAILHYVKELGLNMLRLESKIASERFVEMADEMGIPLMYGWMCCNQWERWQQWDAEDLRVARQVADGGDGSPRLGEGGLSTARG